MTLSTEEKTIAEARADIDAGRITSEQLVKTYIARITGLDHSGPNLHSVLSINPRALEDARHLDAERAGGRSRGLLHGIPILLKDNIESADPVPTTAGSLALRNNLTRRDAPVVARLREAGAVILGKTNLNEWANMRSSRSISGWSAVGGLTRNPYVLDRSAFGSSSGSAAAIAANLAVIALGTETNGSVIGPAAVCGLVGIKPTVGLISRRYIVPVSPTQDTPGPIGRTVSDVAAILTVMAGTDEQDLATADANRRSEDYAAGLSAEALEGKRLGVMRFLMGHFPTLDAAFDGAASHIRAAGAQVVEIKEFKGLDALYRNQLTVLLTEFNAGVNAYLADTPSEVRIRTLRDLIEFNKVEAAHEMMFFGQNLLERAESSPGLSDPHYQQARTENLKAAGRDGIDRLLRDYALDGLIAPTAAPAWNIDVVNGDPSFLALSSTLPAIAGYPHLTVPMGQIQGLPVGLSFVGPAWSEGSILGMGYAFELRSAARKLPSFVPSIDAFLVQRASIAHQDH